MWIALHGYGQQAKYFSKKVEALISEETVVVVPEALNRYYLQGFKGRVGATWMTSDDREVDIEDNNNYLESLLSSLKLKFTSVEEINVLAFSQGIATTCRWYIQSNQKVNKLVLWAGSLAHDINYELSKVKLNKTKIFYVFGNNDEFFDQSKIAMNEILLQSADIEYQLVTFEGKHVIQAELLTEISNA